MSWAGISARGTALWISSAIPIVSAVAGRPRINRTTMVRPAELEGNYIGKLTDPD